MDDRYKEVEDDIPHEGFTFIGNISLIDPPKPGVPEAVSPLSELTFLRILRVVQATPLLDSLAYLPWGWGAPTQHPHSFPHILSLKHAPHASPGVVLYI